MHLHPSAPTHLCILFTLFLGSCALLGTEEPEKLTGPRIDVTLQPTGLKPSASAGLEQFAIPAPQEVENWGQTGANGAHAPGHVAMPANVARAWTYAIGAARKGTLLNAPVVHGGRLFAINSEGEVTALDATTGKRLWKVDLPLEERELAAYSGGLAVLGNLLFVTTAEGQVFALTASTGKQVWKTDLAVPLRAAPTVEGERVFVTSHDNHTFALSALDGGLLWTHAGMEESLSLMRAASPAAANGALVVPYSSGEIYILRASDGRYIWHDTLTSPFSGQDPESTITSIAAPPVVADGLIYAVGQNGGLSAYNLTNGQRFWKSDVLTTQLPIVAGYQIFALMDDGQLTALNRRDGSIRWVADLNKLLPENRRDGKRLWSGPLLAGGRLITASSDGFAISVNPQSGQKLAITDLEDPISLSPIAANGSLYFLTDKGKIICFKAAAPTAKK